MRTVLYGVLVAIGLAVVAWKLPFPSMFAAKSAASFIAGGGLKSDAVRMPARQFQASNNAAMWAVMPGGNLQAVRYTAVSRAFSDIVAQLSGGGPIFFKRGIFAVAVVVRGNEAFWVFDRDLQGKPTSELRAIARDEAGTAEIDARAFNRAGGVYVVPEKILLETAQVQVSGNDQFHSLDFVEVTASRIVDHIRDEPRYSIWKNRRQVENGLAPIKFRFLVTGG